MAGVMAGALCAIPASTLAVPALAQQQPVAGIYSGVPLAYDRASGVVSGYFSETTGRGQFSCIFYFSGHLEGRRAAIVSYFPESPDDQIRGSLTLRDDGQLEISLVEDPGGCWNVEHFDDSDEPARFPRKASRPAWTAIDVVKSARAYFYADANGRSRRRAYVVQGDAVAILDRKGGWDRVEYAADGKSTSGYLRRSDLYGLPKSAVAASLEIPMSGSP